MSQQEFAGKYAPLIRVSESEMIPFAGITAQTRDDKDEIILGSVQFIRNEEDTLWIPVSEANPLPVAGEMQLTGSIVEINSVEYRLLPDGNTLVGPAEDRPTVGDAEAAIGDGVAYRSKDTGEVHVSDGTEWKLVGVLW